MCCVSYLLLLNGKNTKLPNAKYKITANKERLKLWTFLVYHKDDYYEQLSEQYADLYKKITTVKRKQMLPHYCIVHYAGLQCTPRILQKFV